MKSVEESSIAASVSLVAVAAVLAWGDELSRRSGAVVRVLARCGRLFVSMVAAFTVFTFQLGGEDAAKLLKGSPLLWVAVTFAASMTVVSAVAVRMWAGREVRKWNNALLRRPSRRPDRSEDEPPGREAEEAPSRHQCDPMTTTPRLPGSGSRTERWLSWGAFATAALAVLLSHDTRRKVRR